jgi:cobalt-precorrin 5A hydrolase
MKVAGFGFRAGATAMSLHSALRAVAGQDQVILDALATPVEKADMPAIREFAGDLGLPVRAIARDVLAAQVTVTQSARVRAGFGTGSIAEAAALAAAGRNARLAGPRAVSDDGRATAAIAEGEGP